MQAKSNETIIMLQYNIIQKIHGPTKSLKLLTVIDFLYSDSREKCTSGKCEY